MRGLLAVAGAISVAALSVTCPPSYSLVANVLTVTGYTAGGMLQWEMEDVFQGRYCDDGSGNTCSPVRYLSGLPGQIAEPHGLLALRLAIARSSAPTTVVAFSQGATIATHWLREQSGTEDAAAPEDLSFVLIANPLRKHGGVRPVYGIDPPTPESDYHVTDIAIEYDGAADFPDNPFNLLALANAFAGFQYVHIYGYTEVDLDNAEKLVWNEGNTTYVLIRRENIPLLEPLRVLGLHELADRLNGPLKEIIDSAYDRDYPGLVDSRRQRVDTIASSALQAEDVDEAEQELPGSAAGSVAPDDDETGSPGVDSEGERDDTGGGGSDADADGIDGVDGSGLPDDGSEEDSDETPAEDDGETVDEAADGAVVGADDPAAEETSDSEGDPSASVERSSSDSDPDSDSDTEGATQ